MTTRNLYKNIFFLPLLFLSILQFSKCGMLNLKSINQHKKKVGILSLSAIKLNPLIESHYTIRDISPSVASTLSEFLHNSGYVADNYRQWLASANIEVIPILFFSDLQEILHLMDSLDGFVLTGGSESFYSYEGLPSVYLNTVNHILQKAKDINDNGRQFPIWATCLGFEALLVAESGETLKRHQVYNHVKLRERIKITNTSLKSIQFFSEEELDELEKIPLLYFNHMWGISRWEVSHLPELKDRVMIGAKIDTDERRNVAVWMEFKDYPFFGTQFHPEKRPVAGANPFDQKREDQSENMVESTSSKVPEVINLGNYGIEKMRMEHFFNPRLANKKSAQTKENDLENGISNVIFNEVKSINQASGIDDGENGADDIGEGDYLMSKRNNLTKKAISLNENLMRIAYKNVHILKDHLNKINGNSKPSEGVDSIAAPLIEPSLIPPKYLKKVKQINEKFAEFFSGFVSNIEAQIDPKFLNKQIYWMNNIGSYYQVNIIKNNHH
jgi:anthranilate/para-aminobenzoate synthase component II